MKWYFIFFNNTKHVRFCLTSENREFFCIEKNSKTKELGESQKHPALRYVICLVKKLLVKALFGSSVVVVVRVYVFWSSLKSVTCRLSFWVVLVYHKKLSEAFGLVFRVKETSKSEQEKNRREEPLKVFVRLIHTPAVLKLCLLFSNKYCYVQLKFFGKFCTVLFGKLWFFKKEKKKEKLLKFAQ